MIGWVFGEQQGQRVYWRVAGNGEQFAELAMQRRKVIGGRNVEIIKELAGASKIILSESRDTGSSGSPVSPPRAGAVATALGLICRGKGGSWAAGQLGSWAAEELGGNGKWQMETSNGTKIST